MKVLYLHQYFQTNKSAGGTRSYEFSKHLAKKGYEVSIITGNEVVDEAIDENIKIYSTKTKYSNKMGFVKRITSFFDYIYKSINIGIKIKDIDVVFATSTPLTIGIPGYILSKVKKAKFIFEVRDVWPDVPIELGFIKNKLVIHLLKNFEKFIYKKADQIITLSPGMYDNLVKKGVDESKLSMITNLSNIYLYENIKNIESIKSEIGLNNDKFTCIHPGAMGFVNGLDYVLDVAKETIKVDKDIEFILIGEGKEKEHLIERKEKENLYNVKILDSLPKEKVVRLIKSSDIGIMCVRDYKILEDNSANKFFDFLAAGLPIMINYGGWQKKALESNECGYSCKYSNPIEMAKKILYLKQNREELSKMKINSTNLAKCEYSTDRCLQKLDEVFLNIYRKYVAIVEKSN
ncbi:glycosyltransferase WbuB [Paraclostridium bifermentans]|uniref:glycosyltransferase family 4 protein n=1 Tax=Paraclostridium bifermentans TaxID=1490 RepID=UPI0021C4AF3A|nr:glycosyltransferase family 4 protein [Paraclostridium bifermentans]GKZ04401.1 glycosyltransferase WbuB [Paraclostridium bifermentans]GKZ06785.1 glycosyltransferase WbuB [Paraclostridium bifermentans]GKZ11303.1 glycosyltransferase WbuB [Paraclostridium bifermentans]